jgi:hypothetical protein
MNTKRKCNKFHKRLNFLFYPFLFFKPSQLLITTKGKSPLCNIFSPTKDTNRHTSAWKIAPTMTTWYGDSILESAEWSLTCGNENWIENKEPLSHIKVMYEGVTKSFRTGHLERELQMVQLSATRCSCIAILWVGLASFDATTLFVVAQRVFIVAVVYFVIDSVRKRLDTPS